MDPSLLTPRPVLCPHLISAASDLMPQGPPFLPGFPGPASHRLLDDVAQRSPWLLRGCRITAQTLDQESRMDKNGAWGCQSSSAWDLGLSEAVLGP